VVGVEIPNGAKTLVRRTALFGLLAFALAFTLFLVVGGLRLWPRISGKGLPFSLIWPFARPLLAAALELSFLVSVPIALGLSSAARAVRASGVASWRASALSAALLAACLGALSFGISSSLDGDGTSPGQLAAELVASARESCVESSPPATVSVPLLGFSWVCDAHHAPLLRGHAPVGKQAEFAATAITLGDDLKRIALAHFELSFSTPAFPVRVRAEHATLNGLPPWGRSRRIPFTVRAWLFLLSAGFAAYGVARLATRTPWLPAWAGALLGGAISGCLWSSLSWLERQEPRSLTYLVLPAAAATGLVCAAAALGIGRRLWLRRARLRSPHDPSKS
jgi:hypothetical protein